VARNRVCEVLGIERPIILGPMAWITTASLVAEVSDRGGLGVLGAGFMSSDEVMREIAATQKLTQKHFEVEFSPMPDMLDSITTIVEEQRPAVVYGVVVPAVNPELMKRHVVRWKECGARVVIKVATVERALAAERLGADAVVAKGWEGGGHVTPEATTCLVPQVVDAVSVPVAAAGGIADGRGMAAAIALGAEGIELGTAFLVAEETAIHPNAKQAVVEATDMRNVITGSCTGAPCRQIANRLSDELAEIEATCLRAEAAERLQTVAVQSLRKAMLEGDVEGGAVMAGQIAPLVKSIRPAREIMDAVIAEYGEVVSRLSSFPIS
jgi:enoyl-[acyl-carrier protein] reductase II